MSKPAGKLKPRRTAAVISEALAPGHASGPARKNVTSMNVASLVISIFALLVAVWTAHEGRQTRLDTKRIQLRSEALNVLQEIRSVVNIFNCYALVNGVDTTGKDELMRFLADQEHRVRDGLSAVNQYSSDELNIYEKSLNSVKGQFQNLFNEKLVLFRNSMDQQLREKADSVCRL